MCGIAGWVSWEREPSREHATMKRMADTLACRGPDEQGFFSAPHVAFAHRRLSVIDLAGGKQPMRRTHGGRSAVLTYGGEIYNFGELRDELAALGHEFESRSDTEVLLRAYLEWGPACVDHLNGMFAFGIWDEAKQELFLARDRLGIKPLYWAVRDGGLLFASEPKALLAHSAVEPIIDDVGLAEIFTGPARTPGHGVYRDVFELRPGFRLTFDRAGAHPSRYWRLESRPHEDDFDTTTAKVRGLVEDAIRRQLVADVPVCTLLSGGLDSSAVTALAARVYGESGRAVESYSIDFEGSDEHFLASDIQPSRDAPWVERMVRATGARHRTVVVATKDLMEHFYEPLVARDFPSMGEIDVSLLLLFRQIKKTHTVAVSGESADEVFGGYPWFFDEEAIGGDTFPWSSVRAPSSDFLAKGVRDRIRPEEYAEARYHDALAEVPRLAGETGRDARMREILYLNQTRFLPMLLDRKDRMSMAVGLEVRVPFCDHRIVEYLWNVPWRMKAYRGREKGLLRHALEGLLPDDVLWRKKSAYPSQHDPTYARAVRTGVETMLATRGAPLVPLLDAAKLRESLASEEIPERAIGLGNPTHLWAYLLQVNEWMKRYRVRVV